jgi:predicted DNA-binding transcriptional regulator AlpA
MIQALEKSLGIVTSACKVVGISRQTHYNWMEDDEYKAAVMELGDVALDFAESKLHKLIDQGNPAATIFYLKTKGKERGYVERQEIAVAEKKPLSWFTDDSADVS